MNVERGLAKRTPAGAWRRVRAIIAKEWAEGRRTKMLVWSVILVPVLLVTMVLATDYFMLRAAAQGQDIDADEMPIPPELQLLPPAEAMVVQMNEQYMFYLFIIPMMLPVYIAAYSIIGEKQTKTLEPLLATPVATWELLAAKGAAATLPPVVVTWLSFAVLLAGVDLIAPPSVSAYMARPVWVVSMLLLGPLLAFFSVLSGVIVSSRTNDPRTAQQITGIFILPIIGASLVVLAGKVFVSVQMVLVAAAVTLLLDLVVLYFAVKLFRRETILTRWK
jgi:ABC-2 type transport system permease protein